MKEFDSKELETYNGQDGKAVYVAHEGRIIDVTNSKLWKGGLHMKRHHAGRDMTTEIKAAPHGADVLERYPQVGVIKREDMADRRIPKPLARLLARIPMLRRHPHPMTVHFPIVFMFSATMFNVLYLITGVAAFEATALHCLGGGILFTPVAILTGLYTWWLNYQARPVKAVKIKQTVSLILFAAEIVAFIWRILVPDILTTFRPASAIYLAIILSLLPLVTIIGWFGAKLTFPIEGES
jgi:predicted heme/steroid binding protein/uncharacterized membrane protein